VDAWGACAREYEAGLNLLLGRSGFASSEATRAAVLALRDQFQYVQGGSLFQSSGPVSSADLGNPELAAAFDALFVPCFDAVRAAAAAYRDGQPVTIPPKWEPVIPVEPVKPPTEPTTFDPVERVEPGEPGRFEPVLYTPTVIEPPVAPARATSPLVWLGLALLLLLLLRGRRA
jgi:hypothetical protein